jgi:radical SAM superfamily enzyme YgiQ (UPF0313 family)
MRVVLLSTYELGRQPFGLASPVTWLQKAGAEVSCQDLAVDKDLREEPIAGAELVAFYVPMHTATRLATKIVRRVRELNPSAHICFYGLYAPLNEPYLRQLGAGTILGGEFEQGLVSLVERLAGGGAKDPGGQVQPTVSLGRQAFEVPDRSTLPALGSYAKLRMGPHDFRVVGYTEASRGCKHLCRHCPVVPVYEGNFRIVQRDVVLEDVRRQIAAGAEHITFGDPDFFNGPTHAVKLVEAIHQEFPRLTYDVTIKIEHLLKQQVHLPTLKQTGCAIVTSAVEAVDDPTLAIFDKGHTKADFVEVVRLCREVGLALNPTFVTFTPWTTPESYLDLLRTLLAEDLVDSVSSIQYGIRLLIMERSRLLELPEVQEIIQPFEPVSLVYPWRHPDPRVDQLHQDVLAAVQEGQAKQESRRQIFKRVWRLAVAACEQQEIDAWKLAALDQALPVTEIPYLTEPWYC